MYFMEIIVLFDFLDRQVVDLFCQVVAVDKREPALESKPALVYINFQVTRGKTQIPSAGCPE